MSVRIELCEEAHLDAAMDALFRQRYGVPGPDFPHHVVAWWVDGGERRPLCYIHFTAQGEVLLGGGACVDQRLLRRVPRELRESIRAQGGLYHLSLAWSLRHFIARYRAVFGYCGDPLAERVDRAVGFSDTGHEHLLVYWLGDCDAATRTRLIAAAHAVGPF
jgi:hypothetical protein